MIVPEGVKYFDTAPGFFAPGDALTAPESL